MKKKLMTMVIAAGAMLGAWADTETVDGIVWNYTVSGGKAQVGIGGYNGTRAVSTSTTGAITIPSTLGGHPVTSVKEYAFDGCSGLTSVTIPDGVTRIERDAFRGCDALFDTTTIPGVKLVGGWAVGYTSSLPGPLDLTGVRGIGENAFRNCSGLTSVTIPDGVTSIGSYCFTSCSGLTNVTIGTGIARIEEYVFSGCSGLTSVKIPDGVTSIGQNAFQNCSGLTRVTIPYGVTSIGQRAFDGCSDALFDTTNIPGVKLVGGWAVGYTSSLSGPLDLTGVRGIGESAFSYCSGLTGVTIPGGVARIGNFVFSSCSGLTSVTIPNSVTNIGVYAFQNCSGLTSVTIPDSVTSIGDGAFSGCSGLTSVTIGNGVTSIANQAFYGCTALADVKCYPDAAGLSWRYPRDDVKADGSTVIHVKASQLAAYQAKFSNVKATFVGDLPDTITVTIGSSDTMDAPLPTTSFYNYSISHQIYTSEEIGTAGTISSIAFKNGGIEKTRTLDIYLVHTDKSSFDGASDWIPVSETDKVFSGSVTFIYGGWTEIPLDTPFNYNGRDNLAVIVDDNTVEYSSGLNCYVFAAPGMAIRAYSDNTNFDPLSPGGYDGVVENVKNQIQLVIAKGDAAAAAVAEFADGDVYVSESETMSIVVNGGSESRPTSVMLCLSYLTAAAADIDLKNATVDGETPKGGLKFPLTLAWDTGDTEPKTITIPVKPDKAVEDDEMLLFQLADAVGMEVGEESLCCVTVSDLNTKTLKAAVSPYKPKNGETVETYNVTVSGTKEGGFVAGTGAYTAGTKLTLTAEARPGWTFTGWSDCCSEGTLSDKAKYQVVVNGDAEYYATFEPQPYIFAVAMPGDGGKVSGSGYCPAGKKVTLKATAGKGFRFVAWRDEDGDLVAKTPSLVVDRTAKPAASSKTSTTLTGIDETTSFFAVFEGDPRVTATPVEFTEDGGVVASEGGKVTGAGRYALGKKVTLKATAAKGFVFGGWYETGNREEGIGNSDEDGLISQQASFSFEMGEEDIDLYARFVTAEEDKGSIVASLNGAAMSSSPDGSPATTTNVMCGVAVRWPLAAEALSQPTVKVAGLPSGLKFTAKDIMKKGSKTEVEVPANTIYGAPTAASKTDKNGNPTPSKVKVTVTTAGKSSATYEIALTVEPIPEWAVGSFYGGNENGAGSLTVAANGKISGKLNVGATAVSFSAANFDDYDPNSEYLEAESGAFAATVAYKAGNESGTIPLNLIEYSMNGFKTGLALLSAAYVPFFRTDWKDPKWKNAAAPFSKSEPYEYKTEDADDKPGTVTLKFASSGAVTASGVFVTGKDGKAKDIVYKASATATLVPISDIDAEGKFTACVFVNFPPKAGKFAGYSDRIGLRWTGTKFEQGEID